MTNVYGGPKNQPQHCISCGAELPVKHIKRGMIICPSCEKLAEEKMKRIEQGLQIDRANKRVHG